MTRRLLAVAALLATLLLMAPPGAHLYRLGTTWGDYTGYNLVLVTLDTTRADFLGADAGPESGAFANLARESVLFSAAVAPTTTTVPSHASILTGLYPSEHGVIHNALSLDSARVGMTRIFRDAGYRTAAFLSAEGILSRNIGRGFDVIDDEVPEGLPLRWQRSGTVTNERVARWLRDAKEGPFFLWVHYYDPHSPMGPSERAARAMPDYSGPFRDGLSVEEVVAYRDASVLAADDLAYLRRLYEEEIRTVDDAIGGLVGLLRESGSWDRTVVVVAGDHGQSLGENRYLGHDGDLLHEALVHVPLLIRVPPAPRSEEGERDGGLPWVRPVVGSPVGLCDLLPTVLDLFSELPPPPYPLAGRSLLPQVLRLRPRGASRPVFMEAPGDLVGDHVEPRADLAVREGRWKLVSGPAGDALFDLVADPAEERPRPPGSPRERRMKNLLREWLAGMEERGKSGQSGIGRENREALEALGYIDNGASR
ncbi:MAG: sulfatase [Candidatus Eisenbacteria bacterium]